jgi:hypothetical protein
VPTQDEFDELKGRIVELENALKGKAAAPGPADVTPEELATYQKVRAALGGSCSAPQALTLCWPSCTCYCSGWTCLCSHCATECTECVPCGGGGPCLRAQARMGVGRFGGLGA